MGLFGSDVDEEIQELVENAERGTETGLAEITHSFKSGKVTAEKLTNLIKGFKLTEEPLIEYLEDEEQPEYIYRSSGSIGPAVKARLGDETAGLIHSDKSAICVTDQRILIVGREDDGDVSLSLPYDEISSVEWDKLSKVNPMGRKNHTITVFADAMAVFGLAYGMEREEIKGAIGDIDREIAIDIGLPNKYSNGEIKPTINYIKSEIDSQSGGSYKSKVFKFLDEGEEIEVVLKGKIGEIIQGEETESQYAGRGVYTAVTDQRVLILVGQRVLGDDIRNISYDSISGVDLEIGAIITYINIHSGGRTYKMQVLDKESARRAINYIRKKSDGMAEKTTESEGKSGLADVLPSNGGSTEEKTEKDPKERLEELKEMFDEGLISESEFEDKKDDILDDL